MTIADNHLFVRYRRGTLLQVPLHAVSDFKEASIALGKDKTLTGLIKPIKDGMGWGIAAESTWVQMAQEVFDEFTKAFRNTNHEWLPLIEKCLLIITQGSTSIKLWNEFRTFLHENIDLLSGWQVSPYRQISGMQKVYRKHGKYFYEENGEEIELIGGSTSLEGRADIIANSIGTGYGLLHILLRLFAITSLERAFHVDHNQFPSYLKIVLTEGDTSTSFINWQWHLKWPYQMRFSKWRPHDNFCDPDWLANDLLAFVSGKESLWVTDGLVSKEKELHERWQEVFGKTKRQTAFALETTLRFGDSEEDWMEFRGHIYRWLNQTESVYPTVIATHGPGETDDNVQLRTFRFLSQVSFWTNHGIGITFWAGSISSMNRLAVQPKRVFTMQYPAKTFWELKGKNAAKLDLALSLYREGVSSKSIFYAFLSFYKVICLAHGEKSQGGKLWLRKEAPKMRSFSQLDQTLLKTKFKGDIEEYLRMSSRNAISHVNIERNPAGVIDPDNVKDQSKIRKEVYLVQELARHAIQSGLF